MKGLPYEHEVMKEETVTKNAFILAEKIKFSILKLRH